MPRASKNNKKIPTEHGEKKKGKTLKVDEMSESEDYSLEMSEDEEEEEDFSTQRPETDNDSDDDADDLTGSESDESGDEDRQKEEDAKRKAALLKRKRKALKSMIKEKKVKLDEKVKPTPTIKKGKKKNEVKPSTSGKPAEKDVVTAEKPAQDKPDAAEASKTQDNTITGEIASDAADKRPKRELPEFSDKNYDYNLYHEDPDTVIQKRIKISDSIAVSCKMISVNQRQANSFEYAAIVFARKGRTDKAFEYNLPLALAPKIIAALNLMIKDNPKFFQKQLSG